MTLQSKLQIIADRLSELPFEHIYHYRRAVTDTPFLVWQENEESDSFYAGNRKRVQKITGTVDFYTKDEFDPLIDQIQDALTDVVPWSLESVQYEEETELIHYEWSFEVI